MFVPTPHLWSAKTMLRLGPRVGLRSGPCVFAPSLGVHRVRTAVRCLHAMSATAGRDPVTVVQEQLEAYNARDLERFMAVMSEDVVALDAVTGSVLATGKEALRPRYVERFKTAVHSELLGRLCLGDVVVDREIITGLPNGAQADCLATYTVKDGLIQKMTFVWQPRGGTEWKP